MQLTLRATTYPIYRPG